MKARISSVFLISLAALLVALQLGGCGGETVEGPGLNISGTDGGDNDGGELSKDVPSVSDAGGVDSGGGGGICGDKKCDAPAETKANCPIDCDDAPGKILDCMKSNCENFYKACDESKLCSVFTMCATKCSDEACVNKCADFGTSGPNPKLDPLLKCAAEKGCLKQGPGPVCGDGKCDSGENPVSCPKDCANTKPVCGDGKCELGESVQSCPKDCGPKSYCGDGKCDLNETPQTCGKDCEEPGGAMACAKKLCSDDYNKCTSNEGCKALLQCMAPCGDDACYEKCIDTASAQALQAFMPLATCAKDKGCGSQEAVCGNGNCEKGEDYQSCPKDCQAPGPVCGNKKCESGEGPENCPADCEAPKPVCGNGKCEEPFENYKNCYKDCGTIPPPVCGNGKCEKPFENDKNCYKDCGTTTPPVCGNGKCEPGENIQSCPKDCGGTNLLQCVKSKCSSSYNKCTASEGCSKIVVCFGKCTSTNCMISCIYSAPQKDQQLFMPLAQCAQNQGCIGGGPPPPVCGNGQCEAGENKSNCPKDCGGTTENPIVCAKGKCPDQYKNCISSPQCSKVIDCMMVCSSDACFEKCASMGGGSAFNNFAQCAVSSGCVGGSGPVCGDGQCDDGEQYTCPKDCQGPGPKCGNGKCEAPYENSKNCPKDCAAGSCQNKCGGQSTNCYCDNICKKQGDCCPDYDKFCASSVSSCKNKCGQNLSNCSCKPQCMMQGNCCSDYKLFCSTNPTFCGDGICTPPMENSKNCAKDCGGKPTFCKSKADCKDSEVCCGTSQGQVCVPSGKCG